MLFDFDTGHPHCLIHIVEHPTRPSQILNWIQPSCLNLPNAEDTDVSLQVKHLHLHYSLCKINYITYQIIFRSFNWSFIKKIFSSCLILSTFPSFTDLRIDSCLSADKLQKKMFCLRCKN